MDISIDRPTNADWPGILGVLEGANFHHIGGQEMENFPLSDCFVARIGGEIVGVGGYRILNETEAKTTLLAVRPQIRNLGIGARLQDARLGHLKSIGIRRVTTNTDDPRVIAWLERRYGFRNTGRTIAKTENFGDTSVREWTTMQLDWPCGDVPDQTASAV